MVHRAELERESKGPTTHHLRHISGAFNSRVIRAVILAVQQENNPPHHCPEDIKSNTKQQNQQTMSQHPTNVPPSSSTSAQREGRSQSVREKKLHQFRPVSSSSIPTHHPKLQLNGLQMHTEGASVAGDIAYREPVREKEEVRRRDREKQFKKRKTRAVEWFRVVEVTSGRSDGVVNGRENKTVTTITNNNYNNNKQKK